MKPAFLVFDKPAGLTSHDVVAIVRAVTGIRKVGHTGTLDPFATGVLPLALGPATRMIPFLDEDLKVYDAVIKLGVATTTGDPTGEVEAEAPVPPLDREQVLEVLAGFRGIRMQMPPRHSAVKHKGRRLYAYAREGRTVQLEPRPIRIDSIDLVELYSDRLRVIIRCGRGTYARVLADEIAIALGSRGHLHELQRPQSGPFTIEHALTAPMLARIVAPEAAGPDGQNWRRVLRPARGADRVPWAPRAEVLEQLAPWLLDPLDVLGHLALAPVTGTAARRLRNGGAPPPPPPGTRVGDLYLAVEGDHVVAVVRRAEPVPELVRVFAR